MEANVQVPGQGQAPDQGHVADRGRGIAPAGPAAARHRREGAVRAEGRAGRPSLAARHPVDNRADDARESATGAMAKVWSMLTVRNHLLLADIERMAGDIARQELGLPASPGTDRLPYPPVADPRDSEKRPLAPGGTEAVPGPVRRRDNRSEAGSSTAFHRLRGGSRCPIATSSAKRHRCRPAPPSTGRPWSEREARLAAGDSLMMS